MNTQDHSEKEQNKLSGGEARSGGAGETALREASPWGIGGEEASDPASKIAVEIMSLRWTHGATEEEHCSRFGDLRQLLDRELTALAITYLAPRDQVKDQD